MKDLEGLECLELGFDYAYPGGSYYSCVFNDIGRIPELKDMSLNEFGLLSSIEEVKKIILLSDFR